VQRFRLDALEDRSGRLYLYGKPFSGVAYEVKSDRVTANYRVTKGVLGGPAEDWGPGRPRVLYPALTLVTADETTARFPEEGAYLAGVFFDGVAYAFDPDTGALLQEQDFRPTKPGPSRKWSPSGALKAEFDRVRRDGTTESVTWHDNGQLRSIESPEMGVRYTEEGRLRSLYLEPGCPGEALDRLTFRADRRLCLGAEGVTDEILGRLEDLPHVERLELNGTGISARGLERFHVCTNLKKLTTRPNTGFEEADVRKLLARFPGCEWDDRRG
jgi:YD repeat-containing protein